MKQLDIKKHPGGRPSKFTKELMKEICNTIACSNKGIEKLCKANPHWPCPETIFDWRRNNEEFSKHYAQAKIDQAFFLADEIIDICDDTQNDYIESDDGPPIFNKEHVQRARLKIDTRKWIACKLLPKIYGDRTQVDSKIEVKHADALDELE